MSQFFKAVCLLLLITGCENVRNPVFLPNKPLSEGDIVFRRGTGLASRAVLTIDKKGAYSHVGIVVKDEGVWKVIHAVPGETDLPDEPERVKMELTEVFFAPDKAVSGAVMRVDADSSVRVKAAKLAINLYRLKVPFDHSYNKDDTTKMYCSELLAYVYSRSGIDLVEGKYSEIHMLEFSGIYILPSDIQHSRHLYLVESF